jgi:hypothetical protein
LSSPSTTVNRVVTGSVGNSARKAAITAKEEVIASATIKGVVIPLTVKSVITNITGEGILTETAEDIVVTTTTIDKVGAVLTPPSSKPSGQRRPADEEVITVAAENIVKTVATVGGVITVCSKITVGTKIEGSISPLQ